MKIFFQETVLCLECEEETTRESEVAVLARDDMVKLKELIMFADFL